MPSWGFGGRMTHVQIEPTWNLAAALLVLVATGTLVAYWGKLHIRGQVVIAAVRAALQLTAVSSIIVLAIQQLWSAALFVLLMFVIAVFTTTGRVGTRKVWWWSALAMASGAIPVLLIVYLTGTAPLNGLSLIPIGSIVVGNMMTAHTLAGRRFFPELRNNIGTYEAVLALGLTRRRAIWMVLEPVAAEPLVPTLDSTRTVGLVTLPGAFVGVLLGGGTPLQAGASQLLVLVGILVGQVLTVTVMNRFIGGARLLPDDLRGQLRP